MIYRLWEDGAPSHQGITEVHEPTLEVYLVPEAERAGLVIICPGGAYRRRAEHEGYPIAQWLNSIGISAAVLQYRVYPYQYPVPLIDGQRAVRLARHHAAEWGIREDRIATLGFSAGGHLVSSLGTRFDSGDADSTDPIERQSSRPDALVMCYPVISFAEPYSHLGSVTAQLGEESTQEQRLALSSQLLVTEATPPSFLWHTAEDTAVPPEHSMMFALALSKAKVPFELHIYEEGVHGVGLSEALPDTAQWTVQCERWLRRLGFVYADASAVKA
ncbi:alpha/beta hydrolase [Paenibacillus sp. strain BS8-2]